MVFLVRALKADFQKSKHTSVIWIHVIIPAVGALLFLSYYSLYGGAKSLENHGSYFDALAIVFPLLIGLICGMVVSQEEQAGGFQVLLSSTRSRSTTYLSKLFMLILMEAFSVFLALSIMLLGLKFALHVSNIPYLLYLKMFGWLIFSNIFLYIFHVFISLEFGRGASILLGIAGTLIAALMVTGLGDRCWTYLPWAWGVRFCDLTILNFMSVTKELSTFLHYSKEKAMWIMIAANCSALILSLLWFKFWEGRKSYE